MEKTIFIPWRFVAEGKQTCTTLPLKRNEKKTSFSCAHIAALTLRWMFSFHTELSLTCLYLLHCDPGAGSSSHTSTLRAGYCSSESIFALLVLTYTCLYPDWFSSQCFYSLFFRPPFYGFSRPHNTACEPVSCKIGSLFLLQNIMCCSPHSGVAHSFACRWLKLVSGEVVFDAGWLS